MNNATVPPLNGKFHPNERSLQKLYPVHWEIADRVIDGTEIAIDPGSKAA
ncbi:MAG: hypothetical protein M0Z45_07200 [Actinomycetota bacterium]|nr:hypothetical protein [Actinomycetota bacterium]